MTHTSTEHPEALRLADKLAQVMEMECIYPREAKLLESTIRRLHARVQELQDQLANAHQSSGAEAYDIACEEMEAYQLKRAQAGKEVGCTGSLVDGIGWVYDRLEELEASQARVPLNKTHEYEEHKKFPGACRHCGYAEHEELQHGITQEKQG